MKSTSLAHVSHSHASASYPPFQNKVRSHRHFLHFVFQLTVAQPNFNKQPRSPHQLIMADPTSERELSRLESLPGELLNRIYRYAVVDNTMVEGALYVDEPNKIWQTNEPALARTCKKFRYDILPIFYAENTFTMPDIRNPFPTSREDNHELPRSRFEENSVAWLKAIGEHASHVVRVGARFSVVNFRANQRGGIEIDMKPVDAVATFDGLEIAGYHVSPKVDGMCDCLLQKSESNTQPSDGSQAKIDRLLLALLYTRDTLASRYTGPQGVHIVCGRPRGSKAWF